MLWTLTRTYHFATFTSLLVVANTNVADHLFMAWAYHKPRRVPIYRRRRGVNILCGYKYVWDTPFVAEQLEENDTLEHSFFLPNLPRASTIWFYLNAPDGPYGLEIQGPLMWVTLPVLPPLWTTTVYLATTAKGIYHTTDFSGPGPHQPTWIPDNAGLASLSISQATSDPLDPYHRRYVIAGGDLYHVYNYTVGQPATATCVLTNAEALALTGSPAGALQWVDADYNAPGWIYVLFNAQWNTTGAWSLRSHDYGNAWQAHNITPALLNYHAGNIMAAREQGTSAYDFGSVVYVALNTDAGGKFRIYMSHNHGNTWTLMDSEGLSIYDPRCYSDPTDQSIVYMGVWFNIAHPRELYRSVQHGANMIHVDGPNHLGIFTNGLKGNMWVHPANNSIVKVLQQQRTWTSSDFCVSWSNPGLMAVPVHRFTILEPHANNLYLARDISAPLPPDAGGYHVIFTTVTDGITMSGKAGAHCHLADGGGDSVPYNCGGASRTGIMALP